MSIFKLSSILVEKEGKNAMLHHNALIPIFFYFKIVTVNLKLKLNNIFSS